MEVSLGRTMDYQGPLPLGAGGLTPKKEERMEVLESKLGQRLLVENMMWQSYKIVGLFGCVLAVEKTHRNDSEDSGSNEG